ncbi:hypothetical protein BG006_001406 [Podila minutissima]|uniref:Uncharacterized protein n=1 Tax=Podila minutissima TaxID=64525 RepID=A0A9P5SA64_9FUNG|nr:hypothetical protein BG006_001406 [Podila minutissima]
MNYHSSPLADRGRAAEDIYIRQREAEKAAAAREKAKQDAEKARQETRQEAEKAKQAQK